MISCWYISTGYLENYGQDKQQIILLHVYNSIDHVTQYSDDDSEGRISIRFRRYFGSHTMLFLKLRYNLMKTKAPFTGDRKNVCTDKILHDSTLRLHGTGGTGQIFERLRVQVWYLLFLGPKLIHLAIQKSVQFRRSHVNARWNRASFCPCKNLSGPV